MNVAFKSIPNKKFEVVPCQMAWNDSSQSTCKSQSGQFCDLALYPDCYKIQKNYCSEQNVVFLEISNES